ncbi:hypothetical protein AEAC466_11845 [Asticcacaulis sp. AC466]|uniref:HvfC/BufC family peptide modification chaperone n=1 Tax=Asticcacaulis sp. AC466 TaxID=1282362 RepID=UPI0003C40BA6|nr:putative DNA-binding domain-containing protein [Asticcacaulis sp. AC466]ESQ83692.1 hypothetical protein AEAC466_11845 [Asticcacaulis sp. AC466]
MFEDGAEPFFDAFSRALAGDDAALAPWWSDDAHGMAGLSIYRNTVYKGLADAIAASYPTVLKVVGEDWLREAAVLFARSHPPAHPVLIDYGAGFADWLDAFEPAGDMPFLPDLARMDRLWTEAHLAAEADPFDPQTLVSLSPDAYDQVTLQLIPSARLASFAMGIPALWESLRLPEGADALELEDAPRAVLLWRPYGEVKARPLTPDAYAFLAACRAGQSLASAVAEASALADITDLPAMFADLISNGIFAALVPFPIEGVSP